MEVASTATSTRCHCCSCAWSGTTLTSMPSIASSADVDEDDDDSSSLDVGVSANSSSSASFSVSACNRGSGMAHASDAPSPTCKRCLLCSGEEELASQSVAKDVSLCEASSDNNNRLTSSTDLDEPCSFLLLSRRLASLLNTRPKPRLRLGKLRVESVMVNQRNEGRNKEGIAKGSACLQANKQLVREESILWAPKKRKESAPSLLHMCGEPGMVWYGISLEMASESCLLLFLCVICGVIPRTIHQRLVVFRKDGRP